MKLRFRHPLLDLILTKERVKAELNALRKCKMVRNSVDVLEILSQFFSYWT